MSEVIHFLLLGKTLCGAIAEPITKSKAETAEFCDGCVQAMWKEQYRRSVLLPLQKGMDIKQVQNEIEETEVIVEEPRLVAPRRIKSLRQYMR
jgi:hypothetical protein|tara:strand:+ start:315 stop:593 length:279 start_codon:yes stop_codon:yes gene_type:complete